MKKNYSKGDCEKEGLKCTCIIICVQSFIVEFELQFSHNSLTFFHSELTGTSDGGKSGPAGGGDYVVSSKWARDRDINQKIRSIYIVHVLCTCMDTHMYSV